MQGIREQLLSLGPVLLCQGALGTPALAVVLLDLETANKCPPFGKPAPKQRKASIIFMERKDLPSTPQSGDFLQSCPSHSDHRVLVL